MGRGAWGSSYLPLIVIRYASSIVSFSMFGYPTGGGIRVGGCSLNAL